jgi:hypothetical protein
MFRWLKRKSGRIEPEARWTVTVDVHSIRVTDEAGVSRELVKSELSGVLITTNDTGPGGADVWWQLFGAGEQLVCAFPLGATGDVVVVDYLTALPGFDHREMIKAMRSTENAFFPVWRRHI